MRWDELRVVGADAPRRDAGAAVGRPVVQDPTGALSIITRVDLDPPEPHSFIDPEEFEEGVAAGEWLRLPELPALPRHLTLALSQPLEDVLTFTRADHGEVSLEWRRIDGLRVAYADREQVARWRRCAASRLLDWAEGQVVQYIAEHNEEAGSAIDLDPVRRHVRQVFFLTDEGSEPRSRLMLALAVLDQLQTGAISTPVFQILRRQFGFRPDEIDHKVRDYRQTSLAEPHPPPRELMPKRVFRPGFGLIFSPLGCG